MKEGLEVRDQIYAKSLLPVVGGERDEDFILEPIRIQARIHLEVLAECVGERVCVLKIVAGIWYVILRKGREYRVGFCDMIAISETIGSWRARLSKRCGD